MSKGAVVMVTGAAGALGRAVCEMFLARGDTLVAVDLDAQALQTLYGDNERVQTVATDLTRWDATDAALARLPGVSVLCNIAGGFDMGPAVHETADALWQRMMALNVTTLIHACRAVVPGMIAAGGGAVVNVAAASASSGKASMGAYCAAKDAVARLTESMALEVREHGVRVNAVAPSIIDTPANRGAMPDADPTRWVSPRDLAAVIAFLASDQACAVNGAVVPVVGLS
ncbi:SDR family NAD(P)-dependent oxidoreductase [Pandoraea apista]|uniref:SDR family NAD(P)-dependent oxidoreductase n=1 Tax=Pandoraea apista TaxID=93218 RepID=UPI000659C219|nr:SDR family NAD(P)-dependent oxidoreductase [Pandoraea apista]ALS65178.1 3-oxoacyl-ACP reductase [Pandoraea apista]RRW92415.1 SDR family NAD(P)-dependent oxidoreductase [Pandoraea apista]RRX01879.1 SDR family NAD(P)-dependent oxidoreductase [Pandoraea apista]CFB65604.1 3-oxoacyl-[acyl-carrier-protein] reductase FabG [Pandoraea apista]